MRRTTATVLPATIGTAGCAASIWVRNPACRLPHPIVHQRKWRLNASLQPSREIRPPHGAWSHAPPHNSPQAHVERRLRDDHEVRSTEPLRPAARVQVTAVDHPGVAVYRLRLALLEQLAVHLYPARIPREPVQMNDREPELLPDPQRGGRLASTRPADDDHPPGRLRSIGHGVSPATPGLGAPRSAGCW